MIMATDTPVKEPKPVETPSKPPQSQSPLPAKAEASPTVPASAVVTPRLIVPPPSVSSEPDPVYLPSYSRWFSQNDVHECEVRSLPEFFDSRSPSRNPQVYTYLRNSIIKQYRDNYPRKITFTDVRRTLVGDVGSIRRVFDFLESWGLVNYTSSASAKPLKWDEKDSGKATGDSPTSQPVIKHTAKRICNGCKAVCCVACFACEKYDLTLCARCYVRGNYRVGVNSSEFKRVELSEASRSQWTEKETLQLLEAVMHYQDDWRKVAHHVNGRTEKDCVSQFIKLPFGEEFINQKDSGEAEETLYQMKGISEAESGDKDNGIPSPKKRMRLTPLADASNPIMAQVAFLSALAGEDVAEAAAQAAVTALSELEDQKLNTKPTVTNGESTHHGYETACSDAKSMLEKEEQVVERAISEIAEVEMKEIRDKIVEFEDLDLWMEKEREQLEQMKNLLFVDKLNILFHKSRTRKTENKAGEIVGTQV